MNVGVGEWCRGKGSRRWWWWKWASGKGKVPAACQLSRVEWWWVGNGLSGKDVEIAEPDVPGVLTEYELGCLYDM